MRRHKNKAKERMDSMREKRERFADFRKKGRHKKRKKGMA
jgi:hypothetical protein